jgi:hypothetical protein
VPGAKHKAPKNNRFTVSTIATAHYSTLSVSIFPFTAFPFSTAAHTLRSSPPAPGPRLPAKSPCKLKPFTLLYDSPSTSSHRPQWI